MAKILFFDTWTKGIRNFSRLTVSLRQKGFTYKLVHLESWEAPCAKSQTISEIECYDISYYGTSYIYNVLKKEKPDIVLILSLSYLLDRTVVSMCNKLGIKVAYLAHGKIYMKQGVGNLSGSSKKISKIFTRIKSKRMMILLNYIRFNTTTRFRPTLIARTIKEFVHSTDNTMFTPYTEEFNVNVGMVYYESEQRMFEEQRHFPSGMIKAVGNPEMDYIVNQEIISRADFMETLDFSENKYALYLDDGFTQESILTYEEWKDFIKETYDIIKGRGMGLIIKLHPRTDAEPIKNFLKERGILAVKDVDFKNIIYHSEFVFSHSSSTIMYAMILGKAVILPRWGKLSNLIRNYPTEVVTYCESIENFKTLLDTELNPKDTKSYIADNCGVLDGKAIERIVDMLACL